MKFEMKPMTAEDWQACRRDTLTDPECSAWLRNALETCNDPKGSRWVRLAERWAVDAASGNYLVRLPSLMGSQFEDQFCARVGPRMYALRGLGVGDPKVYFNGGSSPPHTEMMEVQDVLMAAFAVHGSYGEDIGRDPIRAPVFVPGPLPEAGAAKAPSVVLPR
ncbi:hypothetical protein [Roseateles sp.]|uniref:hypothetical protein n=1 Tax=Roseateles sp. TaxID=1971397 RepID=UPI0031D43103